MKKFHLLSTCLLAFLPMLAISAPITVGYYPSWKQYSGYSADKIPAANLDIVTYAFGYIDPTTCELASADTWGDSQAFPKLKELKDNNSHLQLIYSIGGWSDSLGFSQCSATNEKRTTVANSIKAFLNEHTLFSGVDLDWEFPVSGGCTGDCPRGEIAHSEDDPQNYTKLVKAIREAIGSEKHISIAGPPGESESGAKISNFDFKGMMPYLDYVFAMNYDYTGAWDTTTTNGAPLYADPNDPDPTSIRATNFNVDAALKAYINAGVPAEKLVMGIPNYGMGWKVDDSATANGLYSTNSTPLGDPENDAGNGLYSIKKILSEFLGNDFNSSDITNHDATKASTYFKNGKFVTFETPFSIAAKTQYIKDKGLAGAMFWELSQDSCEQNSLVYLTSKGLGRSGSTALECPVDLPDYTLQITNTSTESDEVGVDIYVRYNDTDNVERDVKIDYLGPAATKLINKKDRPDALDPILNKENLRVKYIPGYPQEELICKSTNGKSDLAFNFTTNIHIMVNPKTKVCEITSTPVTKKK